MNEGTKSQELVPGAFKCGSHCEQGRILSAFITGSPRYKDQFTRTPARFLAWTRRSDGDILKESSETKLSKEKRRGNLTKHPVTPAIHFLRQHGVSFEPHTYKYEERGGTAVSARELGVAEHAVIKTLIMQTDEKTPLIVLMHGDRNVSLKELARLLKVKTISPCPPETADRHSGYHVGGTSPFGTRKAMPVYLEATIANLPVIYINGGGKGFLVSLDPRELIRVLNPTLVHVAN